MGTSSTQKEDDDHQQVDPHLMFPRVCFFQESRAAGPAPSFCYLLSGQESSVQPVDGPPLSPLYSPPTVQTLGRILQVNPSSV